MFYDLLPYQSLLSITTCSINILSEKAFLRNILNLLFPSVCTTLSVPCNIQGDRVSVKPYLCNSVSSLRFHYKSSFADVRLFAFATNSLHELRIVGAMLQLSMQLSILSQTLGKNLQSSHE